MAKRTPEERFWVKVNRGGRVCRPELSPCWEWTAFAANHGYGMFGFRGTVWLAHRVSWILANGEIPDGQCVLHRCDNRLCVNPEHFFLGTYHDNAVDMERKGRGYHPRGRLHHSVWKPECLPRGESQYLARLTESIVRDIRASTEGDRALAARYGVSPACIFCARTRRTWKHVA